MSEPAPPIPTLVFSYREDELWTLRMAASRRVNRKIGWGFFVAGFYLICFTVGLPVLAADKMGWRTTHSGRCCSPLMSPFPPASSCFTGCCAFSSADPRAGCSTKPARPAKAGGCPATMPASTVKATGSRPAFPGARSNRSKRCPMWW